MKDAEITGCMTNTNINMKNGKQRNELTDSFTS